MPWREREMWSTLQPLSPHAGLACHLKLLSEAFLKISQFVALCHSSLVSDASMAIWGENKLQCRNLNLEGQSNHVKQNLSTPKTTYMVHILRRRCIFCLYIKVMQSLITPLTDPRTCFSKGVKLLFLYVFVWSLAYVRKVSATTFRSLAIIPSEKHRELMCLRLGSADIEVNTGRFVALLDKKARPAHVCPCCHSGQLEDELHVVFDCTAEHSIGSRPSLLVFVNNGHEMEALCHPHQQRLLVGITRTFSVRQKQLVVTSTYFSIKKTFTCVCWCCLAAWYGMDHAKGAATKTPMQIYLKIRKVTEMFGNNESSHWRVKYKDGQYLGRHLWEVSAHKTPKFTDSLQVWGHVLPYL